MQDLKKKKVGVLMGGLSGEREISLRSGHGVASALRSRGYSVVEIDADRRVAAKIFQGKIEVAVLMLHGRFGEDGTIQGMLEKDLTKRLVRGDRFSTADWRMIHGAEFPQESPLPLPVVVKPNNEGSTLGVSIVREPSSFRPALEKAFSLDAWVMVEKFVTGRELTVGLLNGEPLPIIEVVPRGGFYDYEAKYTKGMTEYIVPARVSEGIQKKTQAVSREIYCSLRLAGVARLDFILEGETPQFLEANTIPGMTETSLVPKAAASIGISYEDLCERILQGATLKL
ncbi:MAG: D-alanine--D-alanine ligase [Deltaproteobacteria bacterium]|nr:D-alanine--D-alanine ligase [Deltaproteobacteria bacterium]